MHSNGPVGRVTSASAVQPSHRDPHGDADTAGERAVERRHAESKPGTAGRELRERVAVRVDERREREAADRAERDADQEGAHGVRVYARNGDVDKDGELVDALERRLREAIVPSGSVDGDAHFAAVRTVVTSARARPARWAP
jgi:hypothetical protein